MISMYYRPAVLFVALILVGAGCAVAPQNGVIDSSGEGVGTNIGDVAPDFTTINLEGETVSLSDFRGSPVFIDFWAAWCPFCVGEIPEIQLVHEQYDDVVILGVHRTNTESSDTGKKFFEEHGATYPFLLDESGDIYKTFTGGRPFMPVGIFIDADGIIRDRLFGPKTSDQISEGLEKIRKK